LGSRVRQYSAESGSGHDGDSGRAFAFAANVTIRWDRLQYLVGFLGRWVVHQSFGRARDWPGWHTNQFELFSRD